VCGAHEFTDVTIVERMSCTMDFITLKRISNLSIGSLLVGGVVAKSAPLPLAGRLSGW
jgi:hypothetical protein